METLAETGKFSIWPIGWPVYDRQRVQWTPEGKARYDLLGKQIDAVLETEPPYEELYGRVKANSLVLATLLAISRDHAAPMVDAPDIDLGAAMVHGERRDDHRGAGGRDRRYALRQRWFATSRRTSARKKRSPCATIGNAVRGYSKKDRMAALTDMEELGKVTISRYNDERHSFDSSAKRRRVDRVGAVKGHYIKNYIYRTLPGRLVTVPTVYNSV